MNQSNHIELNYEPLQSNEIEAQEISESVQSEIAVTVLPPDRTLLQALYHEFDIIKTGFKNQEFRDYCMVKGASEQTIPLVLFVPLLMILGTTMCIQTLFQNLRNGDPITWSFIKCALVITFAITILYMVLKSCEIIPKIIRNPLLSGRVTTYAFFILLAVEGFLMLEYAVLSRNPNVFQDQFQATIALVVWQKLLMIFIYDIRLRATFFLCLYIYFALRVGDNRMNTLYNLYKCTLYFCAELISIVDIELKNYASYQLEKSITQTTNKFQNHEQVKFMIPPVTIKCQQKLLQNYSDIFPVAIFDSGRQLLHLSGIMQKQLKLDVDITQEQEIDLVQAEVVIRKLEIIHIYDESFDKQQKNKKFTRQSKFGGTCGLDQNGELLHSLLHGPALQQLRNGVQAPQYLIGAQQPISNQSSGRHLNFNSEGLLDKVMAQLIRSDKDSVQGILQQKIKSKILKKEDKNTFDVDVRFYQFNLLKVPVLQSSDIYLILEDVTPLMSFFNSKQKSQTVGQDTEQQMKELCLKIRSFAATQQLMQKDDFLLYDILRQVQNLETKIAGNEQNITHIYAERFDVNTLTQKIKKTFDQRFSDKNNKFIIDIDEKLNFETFLTDNFKLQQIIDNLLENSLEATMDGVIKFQLIPDVRENCISISVEDNGCGIPPTFLALLNPSNQIIQQLQNLGNNNAGDTKPGFLNHHHLGIESSNYNVKLIGPNILSNSIGGNICCSGLNIVSEQEVGTKITFAIRNMINDSAGQLYLIDKMIDETQQDVNDGQDEIKERQIQAKQQAQNNIFIIPRENKNIKCQIFKCQSFGEVLMTKTEEIEKEQISQVKEKPKLAGLAKLQGQGRMIQIVPKNRVMNVGLSYASKLEPSKINCKCDGIFFINSNQQFYESMKLQQMKQILPQSQSIPWFQRILHVNEREALRLLSRKIKENSCSDKCQGFKSILINCSNVAVDYDCLINSLVSFQIRNQIQRAKFIFLSYKQFSNVLSEGLFIQMPNPKWTESIL